MPTTSIPCPLGITGAMLDSSFSSHLNGGEETFVPKLEGTSIHNLVSSVAHPIFLRTNTTEDGEIEVFDAEKYFRERLNQSPRITLKNSSSCHHQKDDSLEVFSIKEESKCCPQSGRSELSWNSRSVSFHSVPRNPKKHRNGKKKSFLTSIVCKCPCAGKNSVDIDDLSGEDCSRKSANAGVVDKKSLQGDKTSDHLVQKSGLDYNYVKFSEPELRVASRCHFSFRATANQPGMMEVKDEEDPVTTKTLEAIRSPVLKNGKNVNTTAWDAIAEEIKISPGMHGDSDSDASSELFEIKSLSRGSPFLSRQASDGLSGSITPKTVNAPSETSTEWGVVLNPSAAEFNVTPDCRGSGFPSANAIPCPQESTRDSKISSIKETHEHNPLAGRPQKFFPLTPPTRV